MAAQLYGPRTEFGQLMHAAKYRSSEETFDDYCVRYSRAVAPESESNFRRALRYTRSQTWLPAGRQQFSVGRPYLTTPYNCFQFGTEILTDLGYMKIGEMVGKQIKVLSPVSGLFETAFVKNYGKQVLNRVTITCASRAWNRSGSFTIQVTANHRWVLQDGEITEDVKVGDLLKASCSNIDSDALGWIHGFIFGDGTKVRDEVEGGPRSNPAYADEYPKKKFQVRLRGKKAKHLHKFFDEDCDVMARVTYPPSTKGDPFVVLFSNIDFKQIPYDKSPEYIRGFVEGLLSADGGVGIRDELAYYFHGTEEIVTWIHDHLILAGYAPVGKATAFAELLGGTEDPERSQSLWMQRFMKVEDHKGYRVVAVDLTTEKEEVYCVEEPKYHQFTLNHGLSTGNCFVLGTIPDSFDGIMDALKDAGVTLRTGGGIGNDFSTLRPEGEPIRGLGHGSFASGPVSFMKIWDVTCYTILTAGHRRGAMMAVLRVDHPDILKFINSKKNSDVLRNFNISVGLTDEFMSALYNDGLYWLQFNGTRYRQVRALDVWAVIMENNWDWAEPGCLFIDRINQRNPLYYCETIAATNPCAEQPLPPYGACLLGSINIVKLLRPKHTKTVYEVGTREEYEIDWELLDDVVDCAVRANDTVIDIATYPLDQQAIEARQKRRMGIGFTGMADALEILGFPYGSPEYLEKQHEIGLRITRQSYLSSIELSKEKGPFPLFDADKYCSGWFIQNVLPDLDDKIRLHGIRNGLLTSIAPTGTISMCADNVSSGIEPPFAMRTSFTLNMPGQGLVKLEATNHAYEFYGVKGKIADEVTAEEHIDVLCNAQSFTDSSVSKTCNVAGQVAGSGTGTSFDDYKKLYLRAWEGGAKGCTTYNKNGKREGVREAVTEQDEGAACFVDPENGLRTCEA